MTDKTNEAIKDYYIKKIENIMLLKLPKFIKLKFLEEVNFEFINDLFSGVRLPRESYMNIYNKIQNSKRILKMEQPKRFAKINFISKLNKGSR